MCISYVKPSKKSLQSPFRNIEYVCRHHLTCLRLTLTTRCPHLQKIWATCPSTMVISKFIPTCHHRPSVKTIKSCKKCTPLTLSKSMSKRNPPHNKKFSFLKSMTFKISPTPIRTSKLTTKMLTIKILSWVSWRKSSPEPKWHLIQKRT